MDAASRPPRPSRRIALLSGWPWDIARGSGTARYLIDLGRALEAQGARIVPIEAGLDTVDYPAYVIRRLSWNFSLRDDPRLREVDLILALDYDGFALPPHPESPPRIVCPQAVFADLAPTEPEPFRSALHLQAEVEAWNLRGAAAIIAPSRFTAEGVARHYGVDRDRIRVIPHGFDQVQWRDRLASAGAGDPGGPAADRTGCVILAVGKLYPRKGVDLLVRAFARLRRDLADRGSRISPSLRIVGDGVELDRLRDLARDLGLREAVRFDGYVADRGRLAEIYAGADLFCLPSRHETFGFVFLEAMGAGLPVVAVDSGAAPEVIGDAGVIVPGESLEGLAGALRELVEDPARRLDLRERGLGRARGFSWETAARAYLDLAESILTREPAA